MNELFSGAERRLLTLMSPAQLKDTAIQYLREGGEFEAVNTLSLCSVEYGEIRCQRGTVYEVDLTLRCSREVLKKLKPRQDESGWQEERELKRRLYVAIQESLPSGYGIANLDPRVGVAASQVAEKTSPLDFHNFIQPEALAKLGRDVLKDLVLPHSEELAKNGLPLPGADTPDAEFYAAVSKIFSTEHKLPPLLSQKIHELLEMAKYFAGEMRKSSEQELAKYLEVRLIHRATGRGLLRALAGVEGMHQDYPEKLNPLQTELVGWLLSYLRDFLDIGNDLEPDHLIKYEQEITDNLVKLEQAGLRVFTGGIQSKHIFENGRSYLMPTAVVLLAAADDPRIKQDADGTTFIKGLIEKGPADRQKKADPVSAKSRDILPGIVPTGEKMAVNLESLTSEIREFRKVMAETVRGKGSASESKIASEKRDGVTITINGREEELYHVCLWPLRLTLRDRAIDILFKSRPFQMDGQRKVLAPLFLAGNVRLNGLKEKPDIKEWGIGAELASMLKATLEFPEHEPMDVFCRVGPHKHEESEMVFQEVLRGSANKKTIELKKESVTAAPVASNAFNKAGSHWDVTFDRRKTFHLPHTLGTEYLNYLLHHPGQPISAYDLEIKVQPEKAKARPKDSVQNNLDAETIRDYLRQLEKMRAQREKATDDGDQATVDQLDGDMEAIENELKKNGQAPDAGERSRGNVSKAVAVIQRKLRKGDVNEKAFGQHLEQFVSMGYECIYNQPQGNCWG